MNIKKIKKPNSLGAPFTWLTNLYVPPDSRCCCECKKDFKLGEMILIQKKTVYPKDSTRLEDLKFKITGKVYCLKCAREKEFTGLHAVIENILIKKSPGVHAPKENEPPDLETPTDTERDNHDTI